MTLGKNKKLSKSSKKGNKKKIVDPFTRKEWYDVKVPNMFPNKNIGKTFVNRSQGMKLAKDSLKGRVYEVFVADLQKGDDSDNFRKLRFKCEEVQGMNCLCNFHGMQITTDKAKSIVRKKQTLVEANLDVKTSDGYVMRFFCIGFTKKISPVKKTSYAQHEKVRQLRRKMCEVIKRQASDADLQSVVKKLMAESIGRTIERESQKICPLHNVFIRKVKMIKAPKIEGSKFAELFQENSEKTGELAPDTVEEAKVDAPVAAV
ncbi:MAG: putative 40S ribosomal protein S1 [Streblomastix strix]|uniref:Small ribosomal subunit protein eS1 n=1 Tax=Streblomastix strix TaxID=222440 RepID=A0A5J4V4J9_9EUKA|nr:MAG: putative 40S ribosomal protein S1 [Streblomastix strix]